jgi:hypothetical protein
MSTLKELSDAATPGAWHPVDTPWGNGEWIVAGNGDPHAGPMVCNCESMGDDRAEDGPSPQDDAAFIAALVNAYRGGKLKEVDQ